MMPRAPFSQRHSEESASWKDTLSSATFRVPTNLRFIGIASKSMLDISALIPAIQAKLDKLPPGHALDLRTYKRNRSVIIRRENEDLFLVVENGFYRDRFTVPGDKIKKTLKKMLKKEFPRSRKVRVYDLGQWDGEMDEPPKLKTL